MLSDNGYDGGKEVKFMKKIEKKAVNAYINKRDKVSIPELQIEFGLSYGEAQRLKDYLIKDGDIGGEPEGVYYPVFSRAITERTLTKDEARKLIVHITPSWIDILERLMGKKNLSFVDFNIFIGATQNTKIAIKQLIEKKIIIEMNESYRLLIDRQSARALMTLCEEALRNDWTRVILNKSEEEKREELLSELFDGDDVD